MEGGGAREVKKLQMRLLISRQKKLFALFFDAESNLSRTPREVTTIQEASIFVKELLYV